jgi:hypothetical protein
MLNPARNRRFTPLIAAGTILGASLVLAATGLPGPHCLFRALYGIPCPGCGLTRSLVALWRGHLILSLRYHLLGLPLFVACWGIALTHALPNLRARLYTDRAESRGFLAAPYIAGVTFCLLVGVWLLKLLALCAGWRFFLT